MLVEGRALTFGMLLKEKRIGDWQRAYRHPKIRTLQKKLYFKAKAECTWCRRWAQYFVSVAVSLEVKSVGKPCAGKPHARFDERGWETELWYGLRHQHMAKAAGNGYSLCPKVTAPIFDSTGLISPFLG
jgi:hypothetical protein